MSSEEMRIEMEKFVNAGLREGWRGWPLKAESHESGAWSSEAGDVPGHRFRVQDAGRLWPFAALRLFDWERQWIRVGTRLVSHESRS